MRKAIFLAALSLALIVGVGAQAADPADVAFWSSVSNSKDPAELRAYLHAFPRGQFVEIAKVKLEELGAATPAAALRQPSHANAIPPASIEPTRKVWRAIDRVELDVDASQLEPGSNHRLIIVPAKTPDAIGDVTAFARASLPITPELLHMTLPAGPPGEDEIRLLYIPSSGTRFVVAARAKIRVLPGAPGAIMAMQLAALAGALGPVAFANKFHGQRIKLEGQFLKVEHRTTFAGWDMAGKYHDSQRYVELHLGALSTPVTSDALPWAVLCLMPIGSGTLGRVTALKPGDDVVVTGTPATWDDYFGEWSVIVDSCQFAQ